MNKFNFHILLLISITYLMQGCYSFTAVSIPPEIETFYVAQFDIRVENTQATISNDFSEALKDQIRTRSRLNFTEIDPHIEFKGEITRYRVSSEAPRDDQSVEFNRLDMTVSVEYINTVNEKESWTRSFNHFADFGTDVDLLSVQDDLNEDIIERLIEDIYNAAFTNW